jgi:drug/metabolite transporter (DMT)-like permease
LASAAENRRGIVFTLLAVSLFVGNDTLMKLAREAYPAGQAIALRTVFATLVGLALVYAFRDHGKLRLALRRPVLLRAAVESMVAISFIWALGMLPLANITAITMTTPIIIVVLAVLMGIERVGWRRSVAVTIGFIGVLIVVRPGAEGFSPAALVALLSAVLVAIRELVTRSIAKEVPSTVISLTTTVFVGIVAIGYGMLEDWAPIWRRETIYVGLAAVLVSGASFCIVSAFRTADVGVIAGFRYAVVIIALAIGYLVWGEIPDGPAFLGIALIVGSGLYTMHRQRVVPDSKLKLPPGPSP